MGALSRRDAVADNTLSTGGLPPTTRRAVGGVSKAADVVPYLLTVFIVGHLYAALGIGHLFDEDYAVYLQQAWNLTHDVTMDKMGIVQYRDPALPLLYVSPLVYPPIGPLLYAIPVLLGGLNLTLLKTIQLGWLALGLLLFCFFMLKHWRFTIIEVCTSLVVFAGSVELRRSVNSIGSDLPFILFLILGLGAMYQVAACPKRARLAWGVCAGVAIFLAIDVRTIAVALIPTLACTDLIVHRRLRPAAILVPLAVSTALWLGQGLIFHRASSYNAVLEYPFFTPIANLKGFYWALAGPLAGSWALAGLWVLGVFAAAGLVWEVARGTAVAVFIVVYTALLLILPEFDTGARYLVPHLLVFGAFAVRGASLLAGLVAHQSASLRKVPYGAAALGVAWWCQAPAPLPSGEWKFGVMATPAQQTFAAVQEQIPANAILAATKPRSFHLFAHRTTIRLPWQAPPEGMTPWLQAHGVTAVVIKTSPPANRYDYSDCPARLFCRPAAVAAWADEVFHNGDYALFTIPPDRDLSRAGRPGPSVGADHSQPSAATR